MTTSEAHVVDLSRIINLKDLERLAIEAALFRTDGNVLQMSRELGIGRTTLYRKLARYKLSADGVRLCCSNRGKR